MFQYVIDKSSYASWPLLILLSLVAVIQAAYDIFMAGESILVFYSELRYKSYSTRLDRFEKLRLFSKDAVKNIEQNAKFTMAL